MPVPSRRITLAIDSRLEQVAMVAAALRAVCGLSSLTLDQIDELELGVVEAVNNVIRHGYGGVPGMPVAVTATLGEDRVEVEILDRGKAIPAGLLEQADADPPDLDPADVEALPESGMGLRLIKAVASGVRYESRGGENRLRLEKLLPGVASLG